MFSEQESTENNLHQKQCCFHHDAQTQRLLEPASSRVNSRRPALLQMRFHQLKTTVNFATNNRIVNWFTGGLNHQVEHHIFPHISHVHYTKISKIVRETAKEFNLPYNEYKTTRKAIIAHFKHLRQMGMKPALQA